MLVPVLFTFKGYVIRKYCNNYKALDLGIDALIIEQLGLTILYGVYIDTHGFSWRQFLYGQLVSIFFLVGKITMVMAFSTGPGGPI